MLHFARVQDTPLYIHVEVVLIIKSFVFLKHILIHTDNIYNVYILLFSIANLLLFNIVIILAFKQICKWEADTSVYLIAFSVDWFVHPVTPQFVMFNSIYLVSLMKFKCFACNFSYSFYFYSPTPSFFKRCVFQPWYVATVRNTLS